MKFTKKKIIAIIIIFLLFVGGYFYYQNVQKSSSNNKSNLRQRSNLSETVKKGSVQSIVSASGTVQTANYLPVTTSVNGIVKKVYVKEGQTVLKGQKIMDLTLDSEGQNSMTSSYASYLRSKIDLQAAKNSILAAESNILQKKLDFENEKKHNSYQTEDERDSYKIAENAYIQSQADLNAKKAEVQSRELSMRSAAIEYQSKSPTIIASESGIIANIISVEGNKIENSVSEKSVQTVASIKLKGTPIVSVNVTEMDINSVKVGQKAFVTLNSILDEKFQGTVVGIDKIGISSSGVPNYPVIIKMDQESDKILPNMTCEAEIIIDEVNDVLYIPLSALVSENEKTYVFVAEGDRRKHAEIETGLRSDKFVEVKKGLNEGDTVYNNALPTSGFTTPQNSNNFRNVGIPGIGNIQRR